MSKFNKYSKFLLTPLMLLSLNSCAAGAATAAYSVKAQTADRLTAEGEQRIVDRTKSEMRLELLGSPQCQL